MTEWGGRRVQALARVVVATYGNTCSICHRPIDLRLSRLHPRGLSIDHVRPRRPKDGGPAGTDDLANLRPAHLKCNKQKSNRTNTRPVFSDAAFLEAGA